MFHPPTRWVTLYKLKLTHLLLALTQGSEIDITSCRKNLWTASWSEKSGSLGPREAAARFAANRRRSRSFFLKSGLDLKWKHI